MAWDVEGTYTEPLVIGLLVFAAAVILKRVTAPRALLLAGVYVWIIPLVALLGLCHRQCPQVITLLAVVLAYLGWRRWQQPPRSVSHGSAEWADAHWMAPLLGSTNGTLLGQCGPLPLSAAFRLLLRGAWDHSAAVCRVFLSALARRPMTVAMPTTHAAFIMAPGVGKTTAVVIPNVLKSENSMVIFDPKGEVCEATLAAKQAQGFTTVILDPFHCVTDAPDSYNPLGFIRPDDREAVDEIRRIAEAVIPDDPNAPEKHWYERARDIFSAFTALIVLVLKRGTNIQELFDVLADDDEFTQGLLALKKSAALGGVAARFGGQITMEAKELSGVRSTLSRHAAPFGSLAVSPYTTRTTFDPRELVTGRMVIYIVLPFDRLNTHAGLARYWLGSLLSVVTRAGTSLDRRIDFMIDEAAALGHFPIIQNAVSQLRGMGVRVTLIFQAMKQLKACFPNDQDATFLAQMSLIGLAGVNDLDTAKYVSERIGKYTQRDVTRNRSSSRTTNQDQYGGHSGSHSSSEGANESFHARNLASPDEVCRLPSDLMLCFAPARPPMLVWLVPVWSRAFKLPRRIGLLPRCLALAALSAGMALLTAAALFERWGPPHKAAPPKQPPQVSPASPFDNTSQRLMQMKAPGVDYFSKQTQIRNEQLRKERGGK